MRSIIQEEKVCYVCGSNYGIEDHHILGASNRKNSEKYGLKVYLCLEHHRGNTGVHFNRPLDLSLKETAQRKFEEVHGTREDFMNVFSRNYL